MNNGSPRILVIGYGNPGRLDDGLGPALADAIERLELPGVTVESNYQLTVEDAATLAAHDVVIFADATVDGREPFAMQPVRREDGNNDGGTERFTSHHLAPVDVVELAWRLFGREPQCHTLAIRGYEFDDFGERLSPAAQANLEQATEFLAAAIRLKTAPSGGRRAVSGDAAGQNSAFSISCSEPKAHSS